VETFVSIRGKNNRKTNPFRTMGMRNRTDKNRNGYFNYMKQMKKGTSLPHSPHLMSPYRRYSQPVLKKTGAWKENPSKASALSKRLRKYSMTLIFLFLMICGIPGGAVYDPIHSFPEDFLISSASFSEIDSKKEKRNLFRPDMGGRRHIGKREIQTLIDSKAFMNLRKKDIDLISGGYSFHIETTLDMLLQNAVLDNLDYTAVRYIGIVAMEPFTGKVLSMAGFDKDDPDNNACTDNKFPAASVFKIITAAAAIESCGFNSDSEITYIGRKHTLYKSQLKDSTGRKRNNRITLRDSFAQSVNPVFGKLGVHHIEKMTLEEYAEAFGFNREIAFELPLMPSMVFVSDDVYHRAEIASGFNRETTISPLHGALMGAAVLNGGRLVEPILIERITDEKGQMIYRSRVVMLNQVISPQAAEIMNDMMRATVESGTCKKAFKGFREDDVLSKLNIGGKTGTIDSPDHNIRYDWFVGFAEAKEGVEKIVISVVIGHEKYIGVRASHYARMAMREYFSYY
jgi:cell division protein FtsI/penicillin-binding protein 2